MEKLDLVVIGAGINGLAIARAYLEANPSANLVVLEAASTVGGVWAAHRLYPGLNSNNLLGTYEYSDFPMDPTLFDVKPGEHIPGRVMHEYLTSYAEHFNLTPRIRLETKVESTEHKEGGGWLIGVTTPSKASSVSNIHEIYTKKLVLASGMTSEAFLPTFKGSETFDAPIFHCKELLDYKSTIETSQSVVIFGGTKSAWDAVYAYASKGVKVDWILRESGHGPCWMAPPYVTPFKKWLEKLIHTRLLTWFSPCIWGDADGYTGVRRFLHGTAIGRFIVDKFWSILGNDILTLNGYDAHPETKKLKPWVGPFWIATGLSILNYPTNFFDLVRTGAAKIHVADITGLGPRIVYLSNGKELVTDALICATGWKHQPTLKFLPSGFNASLGLPHKPSSEFATSLSAQISRADEEILKRFKRLGNQPSINPHYKSLVDTQSLSDSTYVEDERFKFFRLYRFMIPPAFLHTRDIAFAGNLMTISTTLVAQTQALWITAFFSPSSSISPLEHSSLAETEYKTILHARFGRWRYPGSFSRRFPDFVFDTMPYLDLLLQDLGLKWRRKGGILREILEPYGPEDYKGLIEEWLEKEEKKELAHQGSIDDSGMEVHLE